MRKFIRPTYFKSIGTKEDGRSLEGSDLNINFNRNRQSEVTSRVN